MGATTPKEALLIANGKYSHFAGLAHPGPDAAKLGAALEGLGFRVRVVRDGNREQMLDAIAEFERGLRNTGAIAFFHYGGHGVQVDGKNYLLPADADIPDERRVATRAVALDEVMTAMDAASARASIIVIDACRDNPLPAGDGRNLSRGLSVVGLKPKNSIVIYAAEAGSKALDGLFTPILASSLQQKGRSINQIMMSVRSEVYAKSSGQQTPGEYNQLFEELILGEPAGVNLTPQVAIAPTPMPKPAQITRILNKENSRNDYYQLSKDVIKNDAPLSSGSHECLSALPEKYQNRVVDMASGNGDPDPVSWFVTVKPLEEGCGLRYLEVRKGRLASDDPFSIFSNIFYSHKIISLDNVKFDSRSVYEIAKRQALSRGYTITHATFLLRNKGNQPTWLVWCFGPNDNCLGAIEVRASDGEVISAKGKMKV